MKLRVLLADDHPMVRTALRTFLEMAPDIEVVAEAENGRDVLAAAQRCQPDVVCMDINMPGLNGIEATRQLLATHPNVKVIALSAHTYLIMVAQMIEAGAIGYVAKANASVELLPAIRLASQNQTYLSPVLQVRDSAELARYAQHAAAAAK